MAGKSIALSDKVLNMLALGTFPSVTDVPATCFVALLTTNPSVDDGTSAVEASYTNYARASIVSSGTGWNAPANGSGQSRQITNKLSLNFGTAGSGPQTVTGFAICKTSGGTSVATAGEIIYWNILTGGNQTINNSNPVTAAAAALVVNEE
jgi:hypothetical protein